MKLERIKEGAAVTEGRNSFKRKDKLVPFSNI